MKRQHWHDKLSSAAQLGGIETSVLDNGPGRGTRIAWVNTGTGLRYKIVPDRAMDIADAFFNQHCLSWIHERGVTPATPFSNRGTDWLKAFGGGLLVTCGLSHIGGPESDSYGDRGLHGNISNTSAEIVSIEQPDPWRGKMHMSITGRIRETSLFGPRLELRRTISSTLGDPVIHIQDEVINRGNQAAPHMLLYHFNFGWPLADEGTDILWEGRWEPRDEASKLIFHEGNDFRKCPGIRKDHAGSGEAAAFIDCAADQSGQSGCGLYNARLGIAVSIRFQKQQLPWLTHWQHWGEGEYVTGLEPGTNRVIGQAAARAEKSLIFLEPGESRRYDLQVEVMDRTDKIKNFIDGINNASMS